MAYQHNIDKVHGADKGDLMDPKQSTEFVVDPSLSPITTSSMPRPIPSDPSSIDDPQYFDPSTRHPNSNYHPEKKLSKKKREKKFGVTEPNQPHANTHPHPMNIHATDTFTGHEKEAERAHKRDEVLAKRELEQEHTAGEQDVDEDEEEGDYEHEGHTKEEAERQSKQQHHSEHITNTPDSHGKPLPAGYDKSSTATDHKSIKEIDNSNKNMSEKEKEKNTSNNNSNTNEDKSSQSLFSRASGVASDLASKVMHAPVVSTIMNKVGLGSNNQNQNKETEGDHEADTGTNSNPSTKNNKSDDSNMKTDKDSSQKSQATNEEIEAAGK